jgi:hypothetical protein
VRRDLARHRGELLRWLAIVSLACSAAGMLLLAPAVIGVPLAFVVRHMASRDMNRMGGGQLDPQGRAATHAAFVRAETALVVGMAGPLLCLCLWWGCGSIFREFL